MRTLIWKEWREQRVWAAIITVSTVGVVVLRQGYTFSGDLSTYTRMVSFSVVAALFFGLSSFSRELSAGSVDFIYSRPASWKRLVAAKLLFALSVIAFAALSAAVVYRLMAPDEYVRLLTLSRLAQGVGIAVAMMGSAYILGMACSVVLPGVIGGALTFMVVLLLGLAVGEAIRWRWFGYESLPIWVGIGWGVGIMSAFLLTVRFGLTLSTGARMKRYAVFVLVPMLLLAALDVLSPMEAWTGWTQEKLLLTSVSPSGDYAIICRISSGARPLTITEGSWRLIRLSDAVITEPEYVPGVNCGSGEWDAVSFHWRQPEGLVLIRYEGDVQVEDITMDRVGNLTRRSVTVGSANPFIEPSVWAIASPSGNLLALHTQFTSNRLGNYVEFLDVRSMRKLDRRINLEAWWLAGWADENSLKLARSVDGKQERRTVQVLIPEGMGEE